jgi:hypothetical protein
MRKNGLPLGAELAYSLEEIREQRRQFRPVKVGSPKAARAERVTAEVDAAVSVMGATRVSDLPPQPITTSKFVARCGCPRQREWTTTLNATETYLQRHPAKVAPFCPGCPRESTAEKLKEAVADRGGSIVGNIISGTKKVMIDCGKGHKWSTTPASILNSRTWCPRCAKGVRKGATEARIAEVLAERGYSLLEYRGSRESFDVASPDGHVWAGYYSSLSVSPPMEKGNTAVTTYFKGEHVFAVAGTLPTHLPEALVEFLKGAHTEVDEFTLHSEARDALKPIIAELITDDWKVLNVWGNPQWEAPGKYSWGPYTSFANTLVERC